MDFTERMMERNRSRYAKHETKEGSGQTSVPLKEVQHNTVTTTIASTSGSNKVTIETTVTMRKVPKKMSAPRSEDVDEETTSTEVESESSNEKENEATQDTQCPLRKDTKSRLQRLGVLYSDHPGRLSSPIQRTEERFLVEEELKSAPKEVKSTARTARLAALAKTINSWEDDIRHHPVGEESQGFTRSESSQRLIYDYNKNDESTSSTSSTAGEVVRDRSPIRRTSPVKPRSPVKTPTPVKSLSPVKTMSPVKPPSPVKERYRSPIQMGTSVMRTKANAVIPSSDEDVHVPTMGLKQLRSPRKPTATPPSGSVLDRAQRYVESTSPTKRNRDPAELPLSERLALFERNAGTAVLPKAPFAMSVPAKKLQSVAMDRKPPAAVATLNKQKTLQKSTLQTGSSGSLQERLARFEKGGENAEKNHMKEIISERQKEMEMLKHRWDRFKSDPELKPHDSQEFEPSAPPPSPPPPPPLPSPPRPFDYADNRFSGYCYEEEKEEVKSKVSSPPIKPEVAYPVLKEVKRFKLSPPKPGRIYPCLSDMETESEVLESEIEENENNRSSSSDASDESDISSLGQNIVKLSRSNLREALNESDVSSLGQNIVKLSRTNLKRDWPVNDQSSSEEVTNEIDDFLDEALDDDSDEPTPPKRTPDNRNLGSSVSSTSFEFSRSMQPPPNQPLLHTVSFYRKQQTMTLKPSSPVKQVQIDPSAYLTDDSIERMEEELDRELKLVEQKIDELQQEVMKQQTIISQSSQALNVCYSTIEFSGSTEQVEAEKLLLLATQRRQAALHEIQRLRVEQTVRPKSPGNKSLTERGSLTLSTITVPLKIDVVQQAAKDDQCYHLVCLVHCDEHVLATDVVCAPRCLHSHNRITFPNTLVLNNLYSDFKVTVEVYTMTARNKDFIPHDVKYHINTNKKEARKLRLTPRKGKGDPRMMQMPSVQSPGGPSAVRSSAFTRAGYVIFSLREINRTQFALNKNVYTSVLEGSLHLKIHSEMCVDVEYRGFLTMWGDVSGFGAWHRRWCLLKGDKLSYWKYPDDEGKKFPIDTIELETCSTREVDAVPRDVCARANTFLLETMRPALPSDKESLVLIRNGDTTTIRHLLSADTKEERIQWCQHLNRALALISAWGVAK